VKNIKLKARVRYGRNYFDPDCDLSRLLAEVRKSKTLGVENIKALIDIGYSVEYSGERNVDLDDLGAKYLG
jgi:hypothetical protein